MPIPSGIAVRQSARFEIVLPVRLRINTEHAAKVALRPLSTDPTQVDANLPDVVAGDLIDISRGGVGIMTTTYLPKGCRAEVRICALDADISRPLLVSKVRVQRATMTDSRPAYLLGAAFIDADAVFEHDLQLLLTRLGHEEADAHPIDIAALREGAA